MAQPDLESRPTARELPRWMWVLLLLYGIVTIVSIKVGYPDTPVMLAAWLVLPFLWICGYFTFLWWRNRSTAPRWRSLVQVVGIIATLSICAYLFYLVAFGFKLKVAESNPQIERDASPAALRLLARAPHLER